LDAIAGEASLAGGALSVAATVAGVFGSCFASRDHAQLGPRRRQTHQTGLGCADVVGVDRDVLGVLGSAQLVRRSTLELVELSELQGSSSLAGASLYLFPYSALAQHSGVDPALDRGSGQDHSLRGGLGAMGLADSHAARAASLVELAVVAGRGVGGNARRLAAWPLLRRRPSRNCLGAGLARIAETGCHLPVGNEQAGVLFERIPETARSREVESFCRNLLVGWRWIAAAFGTILVVNLPVWPLNAPDGTDIIARIAIGIRIAAFAAVVVFLVFLCRLFLANEAKQTKVYWGILASIAWVGVTFAVASQDDRFPLPLVHWGWGDFAIFVFFAPFVASASVWGWVLPWKRIAALFRNPRWLAAGIATFVGETYLVRPITQQLVGSSRLAGSPSAMYNFLAMSLSLGIVVLQLAWLAALLDKSALPLETNTIEAKGPVLEATENDSPEKPLP